MRVFNLTEKPLDYRGRTLPPSGGFLDFPDMAFIPDRDMRLQTEKVVAFGRLPTWFETRQRIRRVADLADQVSLTSLELPTLDQEEEAQPEPVGPPAEPTPPLVEKKTGRKKKQ